MARIKELVWPKRFTRALRKRVAGTVSETQFREKLLLFVDNPFDPRLKTHKLTGGLEGRWAFSVAYDCRVVFRFLSDDTVLLIDIGSHDDVY